MPLNEYDELVEKYAAGAPAPSDFTPNPAVSPTRAPDVYDDLVTKKKEFQRQGMQQSFYVSKDKDPERTAKVQILADEMHLPPDMVDRNFDLIKAKKDSTAVDYDKIINEAPSLAEWLQKPENAALGKDDLDSLSKVDRATRQAIPQKKAPENDLGFELSRSALTGWKQLEAANIHLGIAYGLISPQDGAEALAAANKRAQELVALRPNYAVEFARTLEAEGNDVNKAWNRFTGAYDRFREGKLLTALTDFGAGGLQTVGESLDMVMAAGKRPRGLLYSTVENLANSVPSLVLGAAAAQAGGAIGGGLGTLALPGIGTVGGAAAGGTAGFIGGSFLGALPVEIGSWINESLQQRGFDTTNPEDLVRAYSDPKLMAQIRGEAERKGLTTAGVDALFNAFAGKIVKGGAGASRLARIGHAAADVAVQAAGEATSEYAGQVAAKKGFEGTNFAEAIQEGIVSLGHSAGETIIGASTRSKFSKDTGKAAEQVAAEVQNAVQSQHELQSLNEMGQAVKESKVTARVPEKMAELVKIASEGSETGKVFFQTDDFDSYWNRKGLSPAKAAEQIMGDGGQAYHEAKANGTQLEIPIEQYAAKVAPTDDFNGLMEIARTRPDGMTLNEAKESMASLPATMQELSQEATQLQQQVEVKESSLNQIKETTSKQLVDLGIGISKDQADAYGTWLARRYNARAAVLGVDPVQLYKSDSVQLITADDMASDHNVVPNPDAQGELATAPTAPDVLASEPTPDQTSTISEPGPTPAKNVIQNVIQKGFKQEGPQGPRGSIQFLDNRTVIALGKAKDPSTFIHELGHFYLDQLGKDLEKVQAIPEDQRTISQSLFLKDVETTLSYLGVESFNDVGTKEHETWARSWEAYAMEGKSPSSALKRIFNKFRVWITSVYRDLRNLNVGLTPEIRKVFDRMVATEEEISAAEDTQNFQPLFSDPSAFGMTGKKAEAYITAREEARTAADKILRTQVMNDLKREASQEFTARKQQVEALVSQEYETNPVYRAVEQLQSGKQLDGSPLKLSKKDIVNLMGSGILERLPRPFVYSAKNGIHPDVAAQWLGFPNGEAMLRSMVDLPKKQDAINTEVKMRMAKEFPDTTTQQEFVDGAMEAIHNDQRAKVLRLELEHMASKDFPVLKEVVRRTVRRVPSERAIQEQANRIMGSRQVGDISPGIFQRAEAASAKKAGELLTAGDFDGAFEAKRTELLNHELYRASVEAKNEITKARDLVKKIFQPDEKLSKTRDMNFVNAARAVLAEFGLGAKTDKTAESYLQQLKQYDPDAYQSVKALVDQATENVGPYKQVTYDDFVAMKDAIDAMWSLAKSSREIEIDGKKLQKDVALEELQQGIDTLDTGKEKPGYTKALTNWEKTKMGLLGFKAALRRVESWVDAMDIGKAGAFRKYIWNPVSEAANEYRSDKKKYIDKYLEIVKKAEDRITYDPIAAPELNYTFKNKGELLGAILHTGNKSNLSKLLRGRNWGELSVDGNLNTSRWDSFVKRMWDTGVLTKADYEFAQSIWNLMEELKPGAQRAHKEMYGHYFSEITADEVVTPFGNFKGGYVPAKADPNLSTDARIRSDKETLERVDNSFAFPTTGRGATKRRVEQYAAPLALDLGSVSRHIDWALRFTHLEPKVKQVARLVFDKQFRARMDNFDENVASQMLVPWLQRSAQQVTSVPGDYPILDKVFGTIRRRTGLGIMAANVVNAMQQITGISIAATKVDTKYLRNSAWKYFSSPKQTVEDINNRSKFMATNADAHVIEIQDNIDDILQPKNLLEKGIDFAKKHGYFLQKAFQNVVNNITWSGAYDQATERGASETEAVRAADSAVRLTQGSFNAEDVSRFETGTPVQRAFTMFYSYFNMQANLLETEVRNISNEVGLKKGAGRALQLYMLGFMIPAVLSELLVKASHGKIDEDDDDQYVDDLMSSFFGSQFKTATAFLPFVGPTINAGVNAYNDKWYDDRISTSPAVAALESAVKSPKSVYEAIVNGKNKKGAVRDALTALTLLTGAPLTPLARPFGYYNDIQEGKGEVKGPFDLIRGAVSGKAVK